MTLVSEPKWEPIADDDNDDDDGNTANARPQTLSSAHWAQSSIGLVNHNLTGNLAPRGVYVWHFFFVSFKSNLCERVMPIDTLPVTYTRDGVYYMPSTISHSARACRGFGHTRASNVCAQVQARAWHDSVYTRVWCIYHGWVFDIL